MNRDGPQRTRAYIEGITPFVMAKARLMELKVPSYTLLPDGTLQVNYNFTPNETETMRLLDEAIEYVRKSLTL
jgi:hypothetical protein